MIDILPVYCEELMAQIVFSSNRRNDLLDASNISAEDYAVLRGGSGNDTIIGSNSADRLSGGLGADLLIGGGGNDYFFQALTGELAVGQFDTIQGGSGNDRLVLYVTSAQTANVTIQAELARLAVYSAYGGNREADSRGHFISATLHIDMFEVESEIIIVDGTSRTLAQVVAGPSAATDYYSIGLNSILAVSASEGLLANDKSSVGGLSVIAGTYNCALGGHAIVSADGSFIYNRGTGNNGSDSFSYTLVDLLGRNAIATAHLSSYVEVRLSDIAAGIGGFKIVGESAGDWAGYSVSGIGDINRDGYDDMLIGATGHDFPRGEGGAAYVVYGKADSSPVSLSAIAAGAGGFAISGESIMNSAGRSVSSAGDVNGDGYIDLLIGSNGTGGDNTGAAYVVFGKASNSNIDLKNVAEGVGGFKIIGENYYDLAGTYSVSAIKDLNHDGYDDLLLGAGYNDAGGIDAGAAYVVFGKENGAPIYLRDIALGVGGFKITGEVAGDRAGYSAAAIGDINGDGYVDLLIGAFGADHFIGGAYVVFGKPDNAQISLSAVANGVGGFKIFGGIHDSFTGYSVSGAGDVNKDGVLDLLIGINNLGSLNEDGAYVVFGKTDTHAIYLNDVAAGIGGFRIAGTGRSGNAVSAAGDINGDGYADLLIGAPWDSADGINVGGAAFVVFGKADRAAVDLHAVAGGVGGFEIRGESSSTGLSVAPAGDVNHDGYSDLLIGSPLGSSGAAYVVYGKADWIL